MLDVLKTISMFCLLGNLLLTDIAKADFRSHKDRIRVAFVGTSLTAGFGVGKDAAYPAQLKNILDSEFNLEVINAGVSGATSSSARSQLPWVLKEQVDVLVLEIGANDGLRGIPTAVLKKNLEAMIAFARNRTPGVEIVMIQMEAPRNMGAEYVNSFRSVFNDVSKEQSVTLLPFLLDDVAGVAEFNLDDGIHPNEKGHEKIATRVANQLRPVFSSKVKK